MSTDRINLIHARETIDSYLKNNPSLSNEDKSQFFKLRNGIVTVLNQAGWQKVGAFSEEAVRAIRARYLESERKRSESKEQKLKLTQQDINVLSADTYVKTLNFTHRILRKLLTDLDAFETDAAYYSFRAWHSNILDQINTDIEATLDLLRQNRLSETELVLTYPEVKQFRGTIHHQLAAKLGAFYIPTNQAFDPLRGKVRLKTNEMKNPEGTCAGHVFSWAEEVRQKGHSLLLFRSNEFTIAHQDRQKSYKPFFRFHVNIDETDDIPSAIDQLFERMDSRSIYGVSSIHRNFPGHMMGIRKIPHTNQIEFVDSNLVNPAVFENLDKFKIWFGYIYSDLYFHGGGRISIYPIATQPDNARCSIPEIERTHSTWVWPDLFSGRYDLIDSAEAYSHVRMTAAMVDENIDPVESTDIFKQNLVDRNRYLPYKLQDELKLQGDPGSDEIKLPDYSKLKSQVISELDTEISVLRNSLSKSQLHHLSALEELKKRIINAPIYMTLQAIIDFWLLDKPTGSQKTYKELIVELGIDYSSPSNFITQLAENNEINPACLYLLQEQLIIELSKLYQYDWSMFPYLSFASKLPNHDDNRFPKTLIDIHALLYECVKGKKNLSETVSAIKTRCAQNGNNFFSNGFHWRNTATDLFYTVLKNIDINNPSSLKIACRDVTSFEKNYLSASKMKKAAFAASELVCAGVGGYSGWLGGAAIGAVIGSAIPVIGTAVGAILGGVIGAVVGTQLGLWINKLLAHCYILIGGKGSVSPSSEAQVHLTAEKPQLFSTSTAKLSKKISPADPKAMLLATPQHPTVMKITKTDQPIISMPQIEADASCKIDKHDAAQDKLPTLVRV